jgi:DNA-binding beta-propeller fold protein YncE
MLASSLYQQAKPELANGCLRMILLIAALAAGQSTAAAQTVVGTITRPGLRPYSLAVYESGNKVFISDAATGHVLIYDGDSMSLLNELALPGITRDACMVVDETRGKLYVGDGRGRVAVVNAITNTVIGPIEASDAGCVSAKDEALSRVYAIKETSPAVLYVINTADDSLSTVSLSNAGLTTGLGVNPLTHEVFVGYLQGNSLDIIDGITLTRTRKQSLRLAGGLQRLLDLRPQYQHDQAGEQ